MIRAVLAAYVYLPGMKDANKLTSNFFFFYIYILLLSLTFFFFIVTNKQFILNMKNRFRDLIPNLFQKAKEVYFYFKKKKYLKNINFSFFL